MRNRLTALLVGLALALGAFLAAGPASAHANSVSGQSVCQENGSYSVTWTIVNDYDLTETATSRLGSVEIGKKGTGTQSETVPGTTTNLDLTVNGLWSDRATHTATGSVKLDGTCKAPETSTPPPPPVTSPTPTPTTSAPTTSTPSPSTSVPSSSSAVVPPPVKTSTKASSTSSLGIPPATSASRPSKPVAKSAPLAQTGLDNGELALIAGLLLAGGVSFLYFGRRKATGHSH